MAAGDALRLSLPFAWAREATRQLEEGELDSCALLRSLALHRRGLWARECACNRAGPFGVAPPELPRDEDEHARAWSLPPAHAPPFAVGSPPSGPPADWAAYYALRGLPATSPAAGCLDTALSLLSALRAAGLSLPASGALRLHLLGARKELEQLALFREAAACLSCPLQLVLAGPDVPARASGLGASSARLSIRLLHLRGGYTGREVWPDGQPLERPHLVFAPNAGVGAYHALWSATRAALAAPGAPPLVISDFTEEAMLMAVAALEAGGMVVQSSVAGNPFRGVLGGFGGADCALPAYSNGWMACLGAKQS